MTDWPFSVLDLEPGAGRADVKRAYARKLKITNPEDDPDGFQALRHAYETALAWADRQPMPENAISVSEAISQREEPVTPAEPQVLPELGAVIPATRIITATAVPASPSARDELHANQAWLFHQLSDEDSSDAARRDALSHILNSPALEQVSLQEDVEAWLADLIARTSPLSDSLVEDTAARFGWERIAGQIHTPPAIIWVLGRRGILRRLADLTPANAPLHKGYLTLKQPPPKGPIEKLTRSSAKVGSVLALMDAEPALEAEFNADAVAYWRKQLRKERKGGKAVTALGWKGANIVRMIFFGILILGGVARCFNDNPSSSYTAPVPEAASDIPMPSALVPQPTPAVGRLDPAYFDACHRATDTSAEPLKVLQTCNEQLRGAPDEGYLLMSRGLVELRLARWQAAEADFDHYLAVRPGDGQAMVGKGLALMRSGQPTGAADGLKAVKAGEKADPGALHWFAQAGVALPESH